ncbi:hypothetical protein [Caudoviricetes sp.]|nr:hypothetical protein [Caudoviricetes sp.]
MTLENATTSTWAQADDEAAIENESGDSYEPLDDDADNAAALQAGQPQQKAQTVDDDLDEKYRGKTAKEIAQMHAELERKLGADAEEKARIREESQRYRSEAEMARARHEQLMQQLNVPRNQTPQNQSDPLKEKFTKVVAEDENVYATVRELAQHEAKTSLSPQLQKVYQEIAILRAQNYNANLDNLKKSDPEFDKLFPDIQKQGETVLSQLGNALARIGLPQEYIQAAINEVNADATFLPILKNAVIGSKGAEYYADALKQKQKLLADDDKAKANLGGGTNSDAPASASVDEELEKLLSLDAPPGSSAKAREILLKKGLFNRRA